eukprot:TRINITY_DN730_c0_g1_i1.p1 TRINITY_DN730_c0_g1~~TRINITY_DN730_c0_g1_i1.p1  ORF type:complete len:106 (+),score=18.69 TRINITY_DN730_c0_g1_i1:3-320(+)
MLAMEILTILIGLFSLPEVLTFSSGLGGKASGECLDEVSLLHLTIGILLHQVIKIFLHELHGGKPGVFGQIFKIPGLDPLACLCVAHGADDAEDADDVKLLTELD